MNLSTMSAAQLKQTTLKAIKDGDRDLLAAIKAETLARCATRIADGSASDEMIRKAERLAKSSALNG